MYVFLQYFFYIYKNNSHANTNPLSVLVVCESVPNIFFPLMQDGVEGHTKFSLDPGISYKSFFVYTHMMLMHLWNGGSSTQCGKVVNGSGSLLYIYMYFFKLLAGSQPVKTHTPLPTRAPCNRLLCCECTCTTKCVLCECGV